MSQVVATEVEIQAGAIRLAGVLRVPAGSGSRPGLVLTGPFTGVKEQVVGHYAAALAAAGLVTLAFDHRNFGASDGTVRQHEDSAGKLEDLRHATSYLTAHDRVDDGRLGCVGICLGGGYALRHAAFDPWIRALAIVAGAFNDPRAMQRGMGVETYRQAMIGFAQHDQQQFATGQVEYVAAVSDDPDTEAVMSGAEPFASYGTARSATPGWVNQVTRLSIRELLTFDAAMAACATDPTCPFYSGGDPRKAFNTLMASLTVKPLKVGARELGTGLAELGVISVLYEGTDGRHRLTDALAHAALGDGGPLLGLSDGYAGRRKDGSYNNELEAHYAINCIEVRNRPSPDAARRKIKNLGSLGLFDTADLMLTLPCAFWPAPPVRQNRTINGTGAPTILIVGNAGDPVTPIENAEALKNALGRSVLLRWEGDGHTVVGRGVACIDDAVTAYLVGLKAPAPNTSCPA